MGGEDTPTAGVIDWDPLLSERQEVDENLLHERSDEMIVGTEQNYTAWCYENKLCFKN